MITNFLKQYQLLYGDNVYFKNSYSDHLHQKLKPKSDICFGIFDKNFTSNCKNCRINEKKNKLVFGYGNLNPEILIILETPNKNDFIKNELLHGIPGKLLSRALVAIGRKKLEDTFLTSVLKYRPSNNRYPLTNEIKDCLKHLNSQIDILNPRLILLLGNNLANLILNQTGDIDKLRKKILFYKNKPTIITYHPNSLIKNSELKKLAWEDFKFIKAYLDDLK